VRPFLFLLSLSLATAAHGQVRPQPGPGDPRLQSIDYRPDQVVQVTGAVGYQIAIELAPDETVRSIALGDTGAWTASVDKTGNRLFLKALAASVSTNMTVVTDVRTYAFDLEGLAQVGATSPYTIRFNYPSATVLGLDPAAGGLPMGEMVGTYRLRGDRGLRPAAISDDGKRTYIEWPADAPLPATYIRESGGRETLANGYMRGQYYVIDSVEPHLVFRIDRQIARADRVALESRR
jgi:type IV secretion system protein VirB9